MISFFLTGLGENKQPIFPEKSKWYFRWGWQGLLTTYRYKQLDQICNEGFSEVSPEFLNADEKYDQARFACIYGQPASENLRELIKFMERGRLATKNELRTSIRYRDLRCIKDKGIQIKKPTICALLGAVQIGMNTFFCASILLLILLSPLETQQKAIGFFLILGFSALFAMAYITTTIKPYFLAKKLAPLINEAATAIKGKQVKLTLV